MLETTYGLLYALSSFTESAKLDCIVLIEDEVANFYGTSFVQALPNSERLIYRVVDCEIQSELETIYVFFNLVMETMRIKKIEYPVDCIAMEKICKSLKEFQSILMDYVQSPYSSDLVQIGSDDLLDNSLHSYFCLNSMTLKLSKRYFSDLNFESCTECFIEFLKLLAIYSI